jgi:PAS domain S-box-containing protein
MKNRLIKELRKDGNVLKAIIGSIGDAISIQDVDLKVLYQNDAHKKLIGEHVGGYCYKGLRRRDAVCDDCPVIMSFRDGSVHSAIKAADTEKGVILAEVTASPVKDAEGNIIAGIEVVRNITDRIQADNELRETKSMLEDIAHGVTESILLLSQDYKIVWANNAALKQTGLAMNELIGNYCYKATHGRETVCESPDDPCPVCELLETGEPITVVHEHVDKSGGKRIVEVSAYPVRDETGDIVRFVHIARDITERNKLEQEREKLISELRDALAEIRTLKGIIPICASCKKIRNDSSNVRLRFCK